MRPAPFAYHRATSLDDAVASLATGGARPLAGGQSLLPLMNARIERPSMLVDLGRVAELRGWRAADTEVALGAMTTHADVEDSATELRRLGHPALPAAATLIGHRPIRNRGTVGGSLAHADPASEWCTLAVLLDARIRLLGPRGSRTVPAATFLIGPHRTAIDPGELLVEVVFPAANTAALAEFGLQDRDVAVVVAGAELRLAPDRTVTAARLVIGGLGPRPTRLAAERMFVGRAPTPGLIDETARAAAAQAEWRPRARTKGFLDDEEDLRAVAAAVVGDAVRRSLATHRGEGIPTS